MKKFKKVLALILALVVFCGFALPLNAENFDFSTLSKNTAEAQKVLAEMFNVVADNLMGKEEIDLSNYFSKSEIGAYNEYFLKKQIDYQKKVDRYGGAGYDSYKIDIVKIDLTNHNNQNFEFSLITQYKFKYTNLNRNSVSTISWKIKMVRVGNEWIIEYLKTEDIAFYVKFGEYNIDIDQIIKSLNKQDINSQKYNVDEEKIFYSTEAYEYINTADTVWYAETYATYPYNTLFPFYSGVGNSDCQNFASQCIWYGAGGVNTSTAINNHYAPMVSTWYCSPGDHTATWSSVTTFKDFIHDNYIDGTNGPAGFCYNGLNGIAVARVGDLVEVHWSSGGYHVYVVTEVYGSLGYRTINDIIVCAHSPSKNSEVLANCLSAYDDINVLHIPYVQD